MLLPLLGNSWGCDDVNGCCTGCGNQEEFYACADVSIVARVGGSDTTTVPTTVPTTAPTSAESIPTGQTEAPVTLPPGVPGGSDPSMYNIVVGEHPSALVYFKVLH